MTPPSAPPPAPAKKGSAWSRMSPGARILVVIACVAGVFVVTGLVALGAGVWWAFRAGDQQPTAVAVGPDTTGVVRVDLDPDDPAVGELTAAIAAALMEVNDKRSEARLPAPLRGLRKMQGAAADPSGFVTKLMPREVTIALSPPPERGADSDLTMAINLRGFAGMLDIMFRALAKDDRQWRVHKGHKIAEINDGAVGLVGATIVFAKDVASVIAVIDRIDAGQAPKALPERFVPEPDRFAPRPELRAHLEEAHGDASRMLGKLLREERVRGVTRVTGAIDLASGDQLQGNMIVLCADEAAAAKLDESFARAEPELRTRFAGEHLDLSLSRQRKGAELEVRFQVSGLLSAIREMAANAGASP